MRSCKECVYWKKEADGKGLQGECRRHAPQAIPGAIMPTMPLGSARKTRWALTLADDFCGEFAAALPQQHKKR